jgi:FrmR/RcnR family transcriptional regulator, repressor of frmRAB operon
LFYTARQYPDIGAVMPHSPEEKKRVLTRVRKVRGQLDALERALEEGADCAPVLQQLAAIRGAINGVMAGVLESHLREEFTQLGQSREPPPGSIDDVVTLVRTYLR